VEHLSKLSVYKADFMRRGLRQRADAWLRSYAMKWKCAIATAAMVMALAPSAGLADSVSSVENARAKERQGSYLSAQDREQLRRWGGNDSYGRYYRYDPYEFSGAYYGGYDYGPAYRYRTYPY
jgi:hypothetical protein